MAGDGSTDDTAGKVLNFVTVFFISHLMSNSHPERDQWRQSLRSRQLSIFHNHSRYCILSSWNLYHLVSIIDYYYTQFIGNPHSLPTLKATPGFSGFSLIDGDPYQSTGSQGYVSTNVFYRQIRNLILDLTAIPSGIAATGLHWPTAQATSLQNIQINLSQGTSTQHQGIFVENGE